MWADVHGTITKKKGLDFPAFRQAQIAGGCGRRPGCAGLGTYPQPEREEADAPGKLPKKVPQGSQSLQAVALDEL